MLGLGNSVGTPPEGIEAEVLVVKNFHELEARAAEANGRIVLLIESCVSNGKNGLAPALDVGPSLGLVGGART